MISEFQNQFQNQVTSKPSVTSGDQTRYATGAFNRNTLQLRSGEASFLTKVCEYTGQEWTATNNPLTTFYHGVVLSPSSNLSEDAKLPLMVDGTFVTLSDTILNGNVYQQNPDHVLESAQILAKDQTGATDNYIFTAEGEGNQKTLSATSSGITDHSSIKVENQATTIESKTIYMDENQPLYTHKQSQIINTAGKLELKTMTGAYINGEINAEVNTTFPVLPTSQVQIDEEKVELLHNRRNSTDYTQTLTTNSISVSETQTEIGPANGTATVSAETINIHQLTRTSDTRMKVTDNSGNTVYLATGLHGQVSHVVNPVEETDSNLQVSVNNLIVYFQHILGQDMDTTVAKRLSYMHDDFMSLEDPTIETDFQATLDSNRYLSLNDLRASLAIVNKKITSLVGLSPEHLNSISELAAAVNSDTGEYSVANELANVQKQISNLYSMMQEVHPSTLTQDMALMVGLFESFLNQNYMGIYNVSGSEPLEAAEDLESTLKPHSTYMYSTYATESLHSLTGTLVPTKTFNSIVDDEGMVPFYPLRFFYLDAGGIESTYDVQHSSSNMLNAVTLPNGKELNPFVLGYVNPFGEGFVGFLKDINIQRYCYVDNFNLMDKFLPESRIFKETWNEVSDGYATFKTFEEDKVNHSLSENIILGKEMHIPNIGSSSTWAQYQILNDKKITALTSIEVGGDISPNQWPYRYYPVLAPKAEQVTFDPANYAWNANTPSVRKVTFSPTVTIQVNPEGAATGDTTFMDYLATIEREVTIPSVYATDPRDDTDQTMHIDIIVDGTVNIDINYPTLTPANLLPTLTAEQQASYQNNMRMVKIMRIQGKDTVNPQTVAGFTALVTKVTRETDPATFNNERSTVLNMAIFNMLNAGHLDNGEWVTHYDVSFYYKPIIHSLHGFDRVDNKVSNVGQDLLTLEGLPYQVFMSPLLTNPQNSQVDDGMYYIQQTIDAQGVDGYTFHVPTLGSTVEYYNPATGLYNALDVDEDQDSNNQVWVEKLSGQGNVIYRSHLVLQMGYGGLSQTYYDQI